MTKKITTKEQLTEFLLYTDPNGEVKVEAFLQDENIWLSQKRMAELFGKGRSTITEHLKNIFDSGELNENSVSRDFRHTAEDGKKYEVKFYNLDAILSVGYRVDSRQVIQLDNEKITRKNIEEIIVDVVRQTISGDLKKMKDMGLIRQIGGSSNIYYEASF